MERGTRLVGSLSLLPASLAAEAQAPATVFRIGLLAGSPTSPEAAHVWGPFLQALRELGHVEGQSVVIEVRA